MRYQLLYYDSSRYLPMNHLLTTLRQKQDLSLEKLAEMIGVSRQHLAKVEQGEAELKLSQARKCAEIFGISIDDISAGKLPESTKLLETKESTQAPDTERDPRPQITVRPENVQKFKEVLLYILEKVGALPNVGKTVLFKLLYFIDFDYYEKYETQLMGATYRKEAYGPLPVEFSAIVAQMERNGELQEVRGTYHDLEQIKYLPLRSPNLEVFRDARETAMIDDVLRRHARRGAKEISELAHRDVPWKVHDMHEVIDYESVFYRDAAFSVRPDDDEL